MAITHDLQVDADDKDQPGEAPCPRPPPSTCPPRPKTWPTAARAPCELIVSLINSPLPVVESTN